MTRYVLAFAHIIPRPVEQSIVLVEKRKPAWQYGKLNLPGGKIEEGETPEVAACRELREETGLDANFWDASILGSIIGNEWEVSVVQCFYHHQKNGAYQTAQTLTDEPVITLPCKQAVADPRLHKNLQIIIPLCMLGISGWRMVAAGPEVSNELRDSTNLETWVIQL